jgi:hypothetical protein
VQNYDSANIANNDTSSIGTVQLWYSTYCQTNWTKVILNNPAWIAQRVTIPPHDGQTDYIYTDEQLDSTASSFSLQAYAPGATPVWWDVNVYSKNELIHKSDRYLIGRSQGGCDGTSCFDSAHPTEGQ